MGIWALEFATGLAGWADELVIFNGDLFGIIRAGAGSGVWRRTPPNWTRTIDFFGGGSAAVWDGKMFCGRIAGPQFIYVSNDGINWSVDFTAPGAGPWTY